MKLSFSSSSLWIKNFTGQSNFFATNVIFTVEKSDRTQDDYLPMGLVELIDQIYQHLAGVKC